MLGRDACANPEFLDSQFLERPGSIQAAGATAAVVPRLWIGPFRLASLGSLYIPAIRGQRDGRDARYRQCGVAVDTTDGCVRRGFW
jgi:hypothetical protein